MDRYNVIAPWNPSLENPLNLVRGQEVMIDRTKDNTEIDREGWVWCVSSSNSGWVPINFLTFVEETDDHIWKASVNEDFSAQELTVSPGEIVKGEKIIYHWIWCEKDNQSGWLPRCLLKLI